MAAASAWECADVIHGKETLKLQGAELDVGGSDGSKGNGSVGNPGQSTSYRCALGSSAKEAQCAEPRNDVSLQSEVGKKLIAGW